MKKRKGAGFFLLLFLPQNSNLNSVEGRRKGEKGIKQERLLHNRNRKPNESTHKLLCIKYGTLTPTFKRNYQK